jgi:hypothetical protein
VHDDPMQMMHSSLTIQEGAVEPVAGKSPEDLNIHINSHIAAGWRMAHYGVHVVGSGIRHHFIWESESSSPFPAEEGAPVGG